ncbi:MAG: hypothetical protein ACNA8S_11860, partial [Deferrisomatales bacterium]
PLRKHWDIDYGEVFDFLPASTICENMPERSAECSDKGGLAAGRRARPQKPPTPPGHLSVFGQPAGISAPPLPIRSAV